MARPFAGLFGEVLGGRVKAMLSLAPRQLPARSPLEKPGTHKAAGPRKLRVAMLAGCAQKALAPSINDATIRLLTRHNVEVVVPKNAGCCGALTHHMGKEEAAMASARANINAWVALEEQDGGLDAVIINASGCGTTVKEYGFLLREDKAYAEKAAQIAGKAKDITELLTELDMPTSGAGGGMRVTYHSACSMQHGQKIKSLPQALLRTAGFTVKDVPEGHLCCGSAGTYNMLQPKIATRLRDRKLANIAKTAPEVIVAGNLGCITQIASGSAVPVVHTVELLDWATGGPKPEALQNRWPQHP
jgi:glycolate oxidase iron-sulfur subunit